MDNSVHLRDVLETDLPIFFEQQVDEEANYMGAFTAENPSDREHFDTHWAMILSDNTITIKTIVFNEEVAGNILSYLEGSETQIGYWLGREYWGKGIATKALALFIEVTTTRPLYARAAKDNIASRRVLEKNGFQIIGEDKGFAHARGKVVEEFILRLS